MIRTRLDVVVQVKERAEEKAGVSLAKAESVVTTAKQKLELARQAASNDTRTRSDISLWEMTELAHQRALTDAQKAQKELETAQKSAAQFRASYLNAHRNAEVVRRVADSRRDELTKEMTRAEDKQADEAASLAWFRKAG
jgi:flagellar export protein FliJ